MSQHKLSVYALCDTSNRPILSCLWTSREDADKVAQDNWIRGEGNFTVREFSVKELTEADHEAMNKRRDEYDDIKEAPQEEDK